MAWKESKLHGSHKWRKAARAYLAQNPWCVGLKITQSSGRFSHEKCKKPATEVDHIIPHNDDLQLFWDHDNWQGLCKSCHTRKTGREMDGEQYSKAKDGMCTDIVLVCGPPGGGKTTYVKNLMRSGDFVFDWDSMLSSIAGVDTGHKPHPLSCHMMEIREAVFQHIESRTADLNTCWIIVSAPTMKERERLGKRFGKGKPASFGDKAKTILVNPGFETCMERIESDLTRQGDMQHYKLIVYTWFAKYENDMERP